MGLLGEAAPEGLCDSARDLGCIVDRLVAGERREEALEASAPQRDPDTEIPHCL